MKKLLLASLLLTTFVSCEKQDNKSNELLYARAGVYNSEYHYYKFQEGDQSDLIYKGCGESENKKLLDVDFDGVYDLVFYECSYVHNLETFQRCCPPPMECFPVLSHTFLAPSSSSTYEICGGPIDTLSFSRLSSYADTLGYNTRLDSLNYWDTESNLTDPTFLINFNVNDRGPWLDINEDMYIGLRNMVNGTYKYGWIKIGNDNNRMILKEMAFQK